MIAVSTLSYLLAIGVVACACIGICAVTYWFLEGCNSPLRKWRKMHTPSCAECRHGSLPVDEYRCFCPCAIDARERETAVAVKNVTARIVRGTRYCKFAREGGE